MADYRLMQCQGKSKRLAVATGHTRPIAVDRVALKRTLAGYSGDNLMSAFA
jgi:hypothetical protein